MSISDAALRRRRGSRAGALGGGGLILAAALLVSVDVTLRKLASATLGGADELSGYALAIGSTWTLAFVLLERGHVRIDALYHALPRSGGGCCDLLAIVALLASSSSLIAWHGVGVAAHRRGSSARVRTRRLRCRCWCRRRCGGSAMLLVR